MAAKRLPIVARWHPDLRKVELRHLARTSLSFLVPFFPRQMWRLPPGARWYHRCCCCCYWNVFISFFFFAVPSSCGISNTYLQKYTSRMWCFFFVFSYFCCYLYHPHPTARIVEVRKHLTTPFSPTPDAARLTEMVYLFSVSKDPQAIIHSCLALLPHGLTSV